MLGFGCEALLVTFCWSLETPSLPSLPSSVPGEGDWEGITVTLWFWSGLAIGRHR